MSDQKKDRTIEDYLSMPYHSVVRELSPQEGGGYYGQIVELPGCTTVGKSLEETITELEEVKRAWLEIALDKGDPVPLPLPEEYYGRLTLRLPKWLHRHLALRAKMQRVSLNSLITAELSRLLVTEHPPASYTDAVRLVRKSYQEEWAHSDALPVPRPIAVGVLQ